MNRRDFLKIAAAVPVASVVPAIAFEDASTLSLEQAIEEIFLLTKDRGLIAVRPTRIFTSASFRAIVEPILHKHFDDAYASYPDV